MLSNAQATNLGRRLAELFNLQPNDRGFYETELGAKSAAGIGRIAQSVLQEFYEETFAQGE